MNIDGSEETVVDSDDPRIRIFVCYVCDSVEPLPWFDGPPERDEALIARIEPHKSAGVAHKGHLFTVSEVSWASSTRREEILKQLDLARNGGETGLGTRFYDVRNTFEEDAMRCWRKDHNRTTDCADYMSDAKLLLPDTREERKELGLSLKAKDRPANTRLCHFCPYHSIVMQRVRHEQGYY